MAKKTFGVRIDIRTIDALVDAAKLLEMSNAEFLEDMLIPSHEYFEVLRKITTGEDGILDKNTFLRGIIDQVSFRDHCLKQLLSKHIFKYNDKDITVDLTLQYGVMGGFEISQPFRENKSHRYKGVALECELYSKFTQAKRGVRHYEFIEIKDDNHGITVYIVVGAADTRDEIGILEDKVFKIINKSSGEMAIYDEKMKEVRALEIRAKTAELEAETMSAEAGEIMKSATGSLLKKLSE